MSLWQALLILLVADAAMVVAMLLIRRRAPAGSFFQDTQQAAGVFAVAGTTFAVLVAFTFLLAFQSYNDALNDAEDEATAVQTLFHTAEFFPTRQRDQLQGGLTCYGRAVIFSEWRAMRDNRRSRLVAAWAERLERSFQMVHATGAGQGAAAQSWFDQSNARQRGRRGRLAQAAPLVPPFVWMFLIIGGVVVSTFVFFFADRHERRWAQAGLVVAVTTFVVASLLMVHFLDSPYENRSGSVKPTAMRETLAVMADERAIRRTNPALPCDGRGRPHAGVLPPGAGPLAGA